MDIKELSPEIRQIWRVVKIVQMTMGFTMGLYIFTHGPYLYESFGGASDAKGAMLFSNIWFAVQLGLFAVLDVPTGGIADVLGRKKAILWSLLCRMIFFVFLALVSASHLISLSFSFAILAAVAFGFAYTLYSGAFTAWIVDSLRKADPQLGYEHILSRGFTYNFLTQILGAVIGIFCYAKGYAYVSYLLGALACIPCLTLCAGEMEEDYAEFLSAKKSMTASITRKMGEIIGLGFQTFRTAPMIVWLTLVFAGFLFLDNIVCYLWPVYLHASVPSHVLNFYWMTIAVVVLIASAVGSHSLTWIGRFWHRKGNGAKVHNVTLRRWLVFTCLFCGSSVLALGWFTFKNMHPYQFASFIFVVLFVEFAYGLVHPCYETLVNNYIPDASSEQRATILSFGSTVRSLLAILLTIPSGGRTAETTTIGWMIPAVLLIVFTLIARSAVKKKEKEQALLVQTSNETE